MDAIPFYSSKDLLLAIFYTLIFPGFLFTAVVGLSLTWVDRKVTALVQSRIGPPWYQPFADVGKLLGKRMVLPRGSRSIGFLAAPLLAIAGSTLAAVIVFRALLNPTAGFMGDLIVLIYLSAIPAVALIIGGAASRSPYGAIGAGREMSLMLAYEVGFLLAIFSVVIKARSVMLSDIIAYQAQNGPVALSLSGLIALVVALFCTQAKLGGQPFDISEADTEIIGGPLAEYSGTGLALFKLARAMMYFHLPAFLVLMFLGGGVPGPFAWVTFILKLLLVLALIFLTKATHARIRLDQALRLFWGRLAAAGFVGVVFALIGW